MLKYIWSLISIILLVTILIISFFYLPKEIYILCIIIIGVLFLINLFFLNYKQYLSKKEKIQLQKKLSSLYNISDELLNIFYIYFDDSFVIFNTMAEEEQNLNKNLEDFLKLYKNFKEEKKSKENEKSDINIAKEENVESLISEMKYFINLISSLENELFNNIENRIVDFIKKEEFKNMVIEYEYYSEMVYEFVNAIVFSINETSKPLSEQIFIIKQNINKFIKTVKSLKDEMLNENSKKNFKNLIKKYDIQNYEFKNAIRIITDGYKNLENNLVNIVNMIEKIYENSFQIQDISEKINILSVNASIESSRSGKEGYGFKVIAYEIKKLSEITQTFITNILVFISDAKDIAKGSIETFKEEVNNITTKLNFQKEGFEDFYGTLNDYNEDFNSIFSSITDLINEVTLHIDKFNPIFQLYNISAQELENVNVMNRKFLDDNRAEMSRIISTIKEEKKKELLNSIIDLLETRITTDMEIEIINRLCEKHDLNRQIKLNKGHNIELF